jgi:hypothetical protein
MSEFKEYEDQLQNCPICGSSPAIYCGSVSEIYGRSIQTMSIDCGDNNREHCTHGIAIETDSDRIRGLLPLLMDVWNKMRAV